MRLPTPSTVGDAFVRWLVAVTRSPTSLRWIQVAVGVFTVVHFVVVGWLSGYDSDSGRALRDVEVLGWGFALVLVQLAAFLLIRSRPITAYALVTTAVLAEAVVLGNREVAASPVYWAAILGVALVAAWPRALAWLALGAAADIAVQIVMLVDRTASPALGTATPLLFAPIANVIASYAIVVLLGAGLRMQLRRAHAAERRTMEVLDREQRAVEEAVTDVRQTMARDLHDIAAHHITAVIIQGEVAQRMVPDPDPELREVLTSLVEHSRLSMRSLRRMIDLARRDGADEQSPGLGDIETIVRSSTALFPTLDYTVQADPESVEPVVGNTLYRIVQESLANAFKHAPGSEVSVGIVQETATIRVTVRNGPSPGGPRAVTDPESSRGFGLIGIHERAELLHGSASTHTTADGGWCVEARLPLVT